MKSFTVKCRGCGNQRKNLEVFSELPYCIYCIPDTTPVRKPYNKTHRIKHDEDRLQKDVLLLLASGKSIKATAKILGIGPDRVRKFKNGE